ncbi:MAG TPA: TetR/AcrR family transcriptional regulator [Pseudonocardia sp.]|nr:TetR/AcrR family transcriptional regulator [Pseudonocardia sp.]
MKSKISLEQIVETAKRLFRDHGYENTTLDAIAAELGVTRAALYYWVRSKEALLCEIHESILDLFIERFEQVRGAHDEEVTVLAETLRMHAMAVLENLEAVTSFFQDQRSLPEPNAERIAKKKASYDHALEEVVRAAQAKGTVRADIDPKLLVRSVVGMGNWLTQWYKPTGQLPASAAADQIVEICLHGVSGSGGAVPMAGDADDR